MPRPRSIPITDPRHRARLRRASIAQLILLAATFIAIYLAYHHAISTMTRIYLPIIPVLLIHVIQWRTNRSFRLPKGTIAVLPGPHREIFAVAVTLAVGAPFIAISCYPAFPANAYSAIIGGPMILTGLALLFCGVFASRPAPPACPGCGYPLTGLNPPAPCPECAHPLTPADRGTPSVRRDIHLGTVQTGGIVLCLGLMFVFLMLGATDTMYRALPGPIHRRLAANEIPALRALNTAALTPSQRATLADRILRRRARLTHPIDIHEQIDWLATEIAAGTLDPSFTERYAADGLALRIIHDTPVRPDEPFRVSIAGDPPFYSPNAVDVKYFFAGFEIDKNEPIARETRDYPFYSFHTSLEQRDRHAQHNIQSGLSPLPYPTHTLTITDTTPIRARIIVAVLSWPWPTPPTIKWHDDGSYTITPTPLTIRELTAETTLTITPPEGLLSPSLPPQPPRGLKPAAHCP